MRVALLLTGRTEWHGLPAALRRLFPEHEFYAVPTREEVESHPDRFPYDGFTSNELTQKSEDAPPESAILLVERAAQEALGDRHRVAADVVMVLDDVELCNTHQPDRVVRVFRSAVEHHLAELQGARTRTATVLREKVSFHLIVPMIEAWFFGDSSALATAGMPLAGVPLLAALDVEAFQTNDAAYLGATEEICPCWISKRIRKNRPKWLGTLLRDKHPKAYLQWLCLDGSQRNCTTYDETENGGRALTGLRWGTLLEQPSSQLRYLRAFLADLADVLGEDPTTGAVVEDPAAPVPATRLSARPQTHVVRNL